MPNITIPVSITLDKERHMRLTLKGMLAFEEQTGRSLLKGFRLSELSMADSAAMIWACLLHEDKELTYDDVLCIIDIDNVIEAMEAVQECIGASTPKASDHPLPKKRRRG